MASPCAQWRRATRRLARVCPRVGTSLSADMAQVEACESAAPGGAPGSRREPCFSSPPRERASVRCRMVVSSGLAARAHPWCPRTEPRIGLDQLRVGSPRRERRRWTRRHRYSRSGRSAIGSRQWQTSWGRKTSQYRRPCRTTTTSRMKDPGPAVRIPDSRTQRGEPGPWPGPARADDR